jgi:two-component system, OmpR family, sensor kinase
MRSLKARLALIVGSAVLIALMATGGLFVALQATEAALERTLAVQARLDLLTELSGRLGEYGLAAVDSVAGPSSRPERLTDARARVEETLRQIDTRVGDTVASADSLLNRTEFAARSRQLARLRAALALLDRQIEAAHREEDAARRNDGVRGALNAFGAITGPTLTFLVEAERRGVEAASGDARRLADRLRVAALAATAAGLLAAALLYRAVTRPLLRRLDDLRRAAGAIGGGELKTRLAVSTRDELGLLAAGFNRMAARLDRRERQVAADRAALERIVAERTADLRAANERLESIDRSRRRFFADVSHELRTPLTVILGECDLALRKPGEDAAGTRPVLATIRKRAQRLQRRVEDLLRVARSESGQLELDLKPVSVLSVLTEAVEEASLSARRRGIELLLEPGPAAAEVLADREWLRQIVQELIDNSLRHADGASRIEVGMRPGTEGVEIVVADDGSRFPEDGPRLFERFARAERHASPGFGIGLALARWVVERHGGSIRLEPATAAGRGTRAVILLPAERREHAA